VQVGVALAVSVRAEIDGHVVEEESHVGAVVGIEAAEEVLRGLAASLVLTHHEARHETQDVGGPALRTELEVAAGDELFGRGGGRGGRGHDHGLEHRLRHRRGLARRIGSAHGRLDLQWPWRSLGIGDGGAAQDYQGDEGALTQQPTYGHEDIPPSWTERRRAHAAADERGGRLRELRG
jgi:hypothetical protein